MNRWVCFRASCRSSGAREVAGAVKFVSHTLASCDQLKYYSDSVLSEMNSSRCVTKTFNIYRPTARDEWNSSICLSSSSSWNFIKTRAKTTFLPNRHSSASSKKRIETIAFARQQASMQSDAIISPLPAVMSRKAGLMPKSLNAIIRLATNSAIDQVRS